MNRRVLRFAQSLSTFPIRRPLQTIAPRQLNITFPRHSLESPFIASLISQVRASQSSQLMEQVSSRDMTLPNPLPPLPGIPSDDIRRQVFAHATSLTFSGTALDPPQSNERLEFLGDSYLNFCVSNIIFHEFPTFSPGELTALKAGLVSNSNLNVWSRAYGLNNSLVLGYSMAHLQISEKAEKLIADVFEAYIGGVIVSNPQGRQEVEEWLEKLLRPTIEEQRLIVEGISRVDKSAVSKLYQEATARKKNHKLEFKFNELDPEGKENRWECVCEWNGDEKGRATGRNRQEAKHRVASLVLEVLEKEQQQQEQSQ